jgi:hypothetical protein
MNDFFRSMLRWSEVWPLLIPLAIFIFLGVREKRVWPVAIYVIIALVISFIGSYAVYYPAGLPSWIKNNNLLYNVLSILRVLLIGWYIICIPQLKIYKYTRYVYGIYIVLVLFNFLELESIRTFSSRTFAAEGIVLLILCITYFLGTIFDDETRLTIKQPEFLICMAISLFESINFFIYLFFDALFQIDPDFGFKTIKLSKYTTILIGILLGLALYQSYRRWKLPLTVELNN